MSLDHQVFESNTYNQFFGDEEQTLAQGMGQSLNNTLGPASVSGLSSGLVSGLNYDVGVTGLAGSLGPMLTGGAMGGPIASIPGSMNSMSGSMTSMVGTLSSQAFPDDYRTITSNISPTNVIPESLHLNDEIFFNNNQYDQINQVQSQASHPDFVNSMASSSYSLQNYFSVAKSTSPTSLASSTTSSTTSIANNSLATITTPDLSQSTDKAVFPTLMSTPYENQQYNNQLHQQLTTPKYSYNQERHNSTSIPVDQLNLLSLKSMSHLGSGNNSTFSSDQISKSPSPDYYYAPTTNTTNSAGVATTNSDGYNYNMAMQGVTKNSQSSSHDDGTVDPLADIDSNIEERTINPSQLFASSRIPTSLSTPSLSTLFAINGVNPANFNDFSQAGQNPNPQNTSNSSNYNNSNQSNRAGQTNFPNPNNIKLPSSVPYTNIPKLPNQRMPSQYTKTNDRGYKNPKFDFKMNDECYNAISYWLNNTLSTAKTEGGGYFEGDIPEEDGSDASTRIIVNPTGIIKGNYMNFSNEVSNSTHTNHYKNRAHSYSSHLSLNGTNKRRNSIPLGNPSTYMQHSQKLHDVEDRHEEEEEEEVDGHDTDQHDEDYLNSSASTIIADESVLPSAGQKKKRRKSTNTFDGSLSDLTSSVPTLFDGSPDISPTSSNVASTNDLNGNRSRRSSISKIMHSLKHNDSFKHDITDSKITKSKPTKSTSFSGPSSISASSIPVVANAQGAFPCTECEKQFKRSEHLKRHIRSVHSNIRPFHCKYCEKKFSRSDNLAQHLKTHYRVDSLGQPAILYGNPNNHNRVTTGTRSRKDSISKT